MSAFYDIYALSHDRSIRNIQNFLHSFCDPLKISSQENFEIAVHAHEKYGNEEKVIENVSFSDLLDYGVNHPKDGFVIYIDEGLNENIRSIILKFTYDAKIIFGLSIDDEKPGGDDNLAYALEVEKNLKQVTGAKKSSIQWECAPADDEEEFDEKMKYWNKLKNERSE